MINKKEIIRNIEFVIIGIALLVYGLCYNSIPNQWLMLIAIVYIIYKAVVVKKLDFDINILFLAEPMFIKAWIEMHTGRSDMVPNTVAVPIIVYMLGKMLVADKEDKHLEQKTVLSVAIFGCGMFIQGLIDFILTKGSELDGLGYYYVAFTHKNVFTNKMMLFFNFFILLSFVCAMLFSILWSCMKNHNILLKYRNIILGIIVGILFVGIGFWYVNNIRWISLKENLKALPLRHAGGFLVPVIYPYSTSNMWLDFANYYGILVFIPLLIFAGLTLKDAIKLFFNNNVQIITKSVLIITFAILNIYYFIEPDAISYPYLWYVGLLLNGIISQIAIKREQR